MSMDFDAIVVGSGITGGWAAKELTQKGLKVLMIERGRMIEHGTDYVTETKAPWEMEFRGEGDAKLYAEEYAVQRLNRHFTEFTQNHFVNDKDNPYAVAEGTKFNWWRSYQMGGRSLTWGRQSYRWSDYDFGANKADGHGTDWPIRYADLAPWYDYVEDFIGVSGAAEGLASLPDGKFLPPMALNVVEQHVREAIAQRWPDRCLTVGRTANLTAPKEGRAPCQFRSICARGCSYGAYFSTQSSTLPTAQATGRLTVVTDALVEAVDYDPATKKATGVRVLDVKTGARTRHTARLVFLNASAFNSVHILLRSRSEAHPNGLANSSGVLGTHVMDHASTLSTMAIMPGFDDRTTFGNRPTGVVIPRFRNLDRQEGDFVRGYSFQGGALQSGWTAAKRAAGIGADLLGVVAGDAAHFALAGAFDHQQRHWPGRANLQDQKAVELQGTDQQRGGSEHLAEQLIWFKALSKLPDDPQLQAAALAYASDYSILESILRRHGISWAHPGLASASLDHAMWFHRPARVDDWLLYVQDSPSAQNGRGLSLGKIFAREGSLIASVAQEGMIRIPEIS